MALTKVPSNLDATIATTQSQADNSTNIATTAYVDLAVSSLSDSAPAALNTLNEIAAALGDDANYASTTTAAIAAKLPLAGGTMTGNLTVNAIVDADNFKINGGQGSDGQVLTSTGSGIAWESIPAGGVDGIVSSANATAITIDSAETIFHKTTSPTLHSAVTGIVFENGSLLNDVTRGDGKSITLAQNLAIDSGNTWAYLAAGEGSYYQQFNGNHYFGTAASGSAGADATVNTKMLINSAGNVGIGTTSPSYKLHQSGTGLQRFQIDSTDNNANGSGIYLKVLNSGSVVSQSTVTIDNAGNLKFFTGTSSEAERMRIDSSGNVGIGRIDPQQLLEVHKAAGGDQTVAKFSAHNYGDTGKTFIEIGTEYGDGTSRIGSFNDTGNKSVLVFDTHDAGSGTFAERLRIDSSGNTIAESLYVTNDSSATLSTATKTIITQDNIEMYYQASQRLIMGRDQYSSGHAGIVFQDPGYSTAAGGVTVGSISRGTMGFATSNNSTMQNRMRINSVGGIIVGEHSTSGAIQPSGLNSGSYQGITFNSPNVSSPRHCYSWSNGLYWWNGSNEGSLAASGAWTNGSDIAFKKNVADIEYGLSTVLDLQPRKYQMKLDSADDIGFIAQEMETIIPEIVHTNVNSGYKSLDYGAITAVLVKAVQEQQALIESLTARIATLEE